jgi:hypothetical protein
MIKKFRQDLSASDRLFYAAVVVLGEQFFPEASLFEAFCFHFMRSQFSHQFDAFK